LFGKKIQEEAFWTTPEEVCTMPAIVWFGKNLRSPIVRLKNLTTQSVHRARTKKVPLTEPSLCSGAPVPPKAQQDSNL
jgi:hypothetical protein